MRPFKILMRRVLVVISANNLEQLGPGCRLFKQYILECPGRTLPQHSIDPALDLVHDRGCFLNIGMAWGSRLHVFVDRNLDRIQKAGNPLAPLARDRPVTADTTFRPRCFSGEYYGDAEAVGLGHSTPVALFLRDGIGGLSLGSKPEAEAHLKHVLTEDLLAIHKDRKPVVRWEVWVFLSDPQVRLLDWISAAGRGEPMGRLDVREPLGRRCAKI